MKIAFLNIYNGLVERGSEVFVSEMADGLSRNHHVAVFQSGKKTKDYQKSVKHIPYIKNQNLLYDFAVFLFTLKCLPSLWNGKYDWIIPVNGPFQALLIRILIFFRGGKMLISGHAGVGREDRLNIILGSPDIFIALSPLALNWALKFTDKVKYIPNGVNCTKFTPDGKKADINLKKPVILINSALLPYKRIDLAIKAVVKLENTSLLIIGTGPLKKEIEDLGKRLLHEKFQLIPKVSYDKIPEYYRSASLFTLPSMESEAFGLVYLEALSSNVPVVAPNDYKKALIKSLNQNWGHNPRLQAEKFCWEKIVKEYEKVFNQA